MHLVDQHGDVRRIHVRRHAVAEVEHVAIARTAVAVAVAVQHRACLRERGRFAHRPLGGGGAQVDAGRGIGIGIVCARGEREPGTPVAIQPEQHRIVAKIEELFSELDKGIENLKTAQAQLKVYRQAMLKHAFEGKLTAQWRADNPDKLETADALLKRIQKDGEAGEDEVVRAEKELDKVTHTYTDQVDELVKHKEAELLEV